MTTNQYHIQLEDLKRQLQIQLANNKEEKQKVIEMEEVILVCKEQITGFDQINNMSQSIIEKLERQVQEYKNELEQAKDTIEH